MGDMDMSMETASSMNETLNETLDQSGVSLDQTANASALTMDGIDASTIDDASFLLSGDLSAGVEPPPTVVFPLPRDFDGEAVRLELQQAVVDLSARGLYQSSKWCAEQLVGLPEADGTASTAGVVPSASWTPQDIAESSRILLARSYFDVKEFDRASAVLSDAISPMGTFLRGYALYLAGEKRKEQEKLDLVGPIDSCPVVNAELAKLRDEFSAYEAAGRLDAFGLYLYGVILQAMDMKQRALGLFVSAASAYPCLWAAWVEIARLCSDADIAADLPLPDHWMRSFYMAHYSIETQQNSSALAAYADLEAAFPSSNYVLAQTAVATYNLRLFDDAEHLFEQLLDRDPYRLEAMDTYSNILYVKEQRPRLSYLAHHAAFTEKYKPETCCIIGNYYSLKSEHEKAVVYFRRALQLNRSYLSAWTLMGHEYVEMKNTTAAIEAYRRAVDISPRDYRAWYGLGQTYEILKLHFYALYYYRKAATLRPYDARMWCAMANSYELLRRLPEAIKCYERAECNTDRDGIALSKLAYLYHKVGNKKEAARCYRLNLERMDRDGIEDRETVAALVYLAKYYSQQRDVSLLREAEEYATRLLDFGGPSKEDAKAVLSRIRSTRAASRGGGESRAMFTPTPPPDRFSP